MLIRFAAAIAAVVITTSAIAQEFRVGSIKIELPWIRATPTGAKVAGGFMRIENTGTVPDRLIGGSVAVAGRFEVHEMTMIDNVMKMRELAGGLEIKPGHSVELRPGSYHVMFVDLQGTLKEGDKIKGTLRFERAGAVDVEYVVRGMGSQSGGAHGMKH